MSDRSFGFCAGLEFNVHRVGASARGLPRATLAAWLVVAVVWCAALAVSLTPGRASAADDHGAGATPAPAPVPAPAPGPAPAPLPTPETTDTPPPPSEYEHLRVSRIQFVGLVTVPEALLRKVMVTAEGQLYNFETLDRDFERIKDLSLFYRPADGNFGFTATPEKIAGVWRMKIVFTMREHPLIEGLEFVRVVPAQNAKGVDTDKVVPAPNDPHDLILSDSKIFDSIKSREVAPDLKLDSNRERRLALINAIALETQAAWLRDQKAHRIPEGLPYYRYRDLMLDQFLAAGGNDESGPQSKSEGLSIHDGADDFVQQPHTKAVTGQPGLASVGRLDLQTVGQDAKAIAEAYRQEGYSNVRVTYKVTPITIGPDGHPLFVHLTFQILEGDRVFPAAVEFSGTNVIPDEALLAGIRSRPFTLIPPIFLEDRASAIQNEQLKTDAAEVRNFIRRQGYMNAEVGTPLVQADRSRPPRRGMGTHAYWYEAKIIFPITYAGTNDRHFAARITITGNQTVSVEEIREAMAIHSMGPYSDELKKADQKAIEDLYQSRGRLTTRVDLEETQVPADDPLVAEARRRGMNVVIDQGLSNLHNLTVHINEGPEVSIGRIFVRGNTETRDDVIYRELRLAPGMRYDSRLIEASKRALENTQLFSSVRIEPEETKTGDQLVRDLLVSVVESHQTGSLVLGFGFSSVDKLFANLTFDQKNFDITDWPQSWRDFWLRPPFVRSLKGGGEDFNIQLQVGGQASSANVTFTEPWFMGRPYDFVTNLAVIRTNEINYDDQRSRFSVGLGRRFGDINTWNLGAHYTIEEIRILNLDANAPLGIREVAGSNLISRYTGTLTYDSRDLKAFPTSGDYLEWTGEVAGGPLSDFDFVKGIFRGTHYMTLYENSEELRHTMLFSIELARVAPFGKSTFVPVFDRFFAGSIGSVRGFQRHSISPRDQGEVVGGENELTFTVQYSFPIIAENDPNLLLGSAPHRQRSYFDAYQREILRGIVFLDGGTVTNPSSPATTGAGFTDQKYFRMSVGVGIMLRVPQLPVPLKIYYARAIRKAPDDAVERVQLDLSAFFGQ
ncbi:MAG: BamA/TamA family outer membrane protein [Planctomycetota bacterium]